MDSVMTSAKYLNEHMEEAPVLMIPCLEGRPDGAPAGTDVDAAISFIARRKAPFHRRLEKRTSR